MTSEVKNSPPPFSFINIQETGQALNEAAVSLDLERVQALIARIDDLASLEKKWVDAIAEVRSVWQGIGMSLPDRAIRLYARDALDKSSRQQWKSQLETARKIAELLCKKDCNYQIRQSDYGVLRDQKRYVIAYEKKVCLLMLAALSLDYRDVEIRSNSFIYGPLGSDEERIQDLEEIKQQVEKYFSTSNDQTNAILQILSDGIKTSKKHQTWQKYKSIHHKNVRQYQAKACLLPIL